jgi:hypothetical protein
MSFVNVDVYTRIRTRKDTHTHSLSHTHTNMLFLFFYLLFFNYSTRSEDSAPLSQPQQLQHACIYIQVV